MKVLQIVLLSLFATTAYATTYAVNSPLDFPDDDIGDGVCDSTLGTFCTLRAAIEEANSDSSADTIIFSFSSGSDILGIILTNGALPTITQTLSIDGRTVAGYNDSSGGLGGIGNMISGNTNQGILGSGNNLLLHGNLIADGGDAMDLVGNNLLITENTMNFVDSGLTLTASDNSVIDNNEVYDSAGAGILVSGGTGSADNNDITNNRVNEVSSGGAAILLESGDNNLISGNQVWNINTAGIISTISAATGSG